MAKNAQNVTNPSQNDAAKSVIPGMPVQQLQPLPQYAAALTSPGAAAKPTQPQPLAESERQRQQQQQQQQPVSPMNVVDYNSGGGPSSAAQAGPPSPHSIAAQVEVVTLENLGTLNQQNEWDREKSREATASVSSIASSASLASEPDRSTVQATYVNTVANATPFPIELSTPRDPRNQSKAKRGRRRSVQFDLPSDGAQELPSPEPEPEPRATFNRPLWDTGGDGGGGDGGGVMIDDDEPPSRQHSGNAAAASEARGWSGGGGPRRSSSNSSVKEWESRRDRDKRDGSRERDRDRARDRGHGVGRSASDSSYEGHGVTGGKYDDLFQHHNSTSSNDVDVKLSRLLSKVRDLKERSPANSPQRPGRAGSDEYSSAPPSTLGSRNGNGNGNGTRSAAAKGSSITIDLAYDAGATTGVVETIAIDKAGGSLGLKIAGGAETALGALFVAQIRPGSAAEADGRVSEGDRILSVQSVETLLMSQPDLVRFLKAVTEDVIEFELMRIGTRQWNALQGKPAASGAAVSSAEVSRTAKAKAGRGGTSTSGAAKASSSGGADGVAALPSSKSSRRLSGGGSSSSAWVGGGGGGYTSRSSSSTSSYTTTKVAA